MDKWTDGWSVLFHRSMTYVLRSIDDSGVVAELQGADDRCSNAQHQVKRYLLKDNVQKKGFSQRGDQFKQCQQGMARVVREPMHRICGDTMRIV